MSKKRKRSLLSWIGSQTSTVKSAIIIAVFSIVGAIITGSFQLLTVYIGRSASLIPTAIDLPQKLTPTPNLQDTIPYTAINTYISPVDGMVMVYVPAGPFTMGDEFSYEDEKPSHSVYLDGFWIDQTEVTNQMYQSCVDGGGCEVPTTTADNYSLFSSSLNHPVVYVSWYDAVSYCGWAGRELPSEAQWEKAATWDDTNKVKNLFPWGSSEIDCALANYGSYDGYTACIGSTTVVGSYPDGASYYGVLDMTGNVAEWVNDWHDPDYYANSPFSNPPGPSSGSAKVLRGGSWYPVWSQYYYPTNRIPIYPTERSSFAGFRCSMRDSP